MWIGLSHPVHYETTKNDLQSDAVRHAMCGWNLTETLKPPLGGLHLHRPCIGLLFP